MSFLWKAANLFMFPRTLFRLGIFGNLITKHCHKNEIFCFLYIKVHHVRCKTSASQREDMAPYVYSLSSMHGWSLLCQLGILFFVLFCYLWFTVDNRLWLFPMWTNFLNISLKDRIDASLSERRDKIHLTSPSWTFRSFKTFTIINIIVMNDKAQNYLQLPLHVPLGRVLRSGIPWSKVVPNLKHFIKLHFRKIAYKITLIGHAWKCPFPQILTHTGQFVFFNFCRFDAIELMLCCSFNFHFSDYKR